MLCDPQNADECTTVHRMHQSKKKKKQEKKKTEYHASKKLTPFYFIIGYFSF